MAIRRWARTGSVLLAVALWLCLGLALPIVLGLYSIDVATDTVEAAPGDAFALSGPVVLSGSPAIRIQRGTVAFIDGNGKALPSASLPADVGQSSYNLRIYNGTVSIGESAEPGQAGAFPSSPFAEVLAGGRYETLSLRRSTVVLHGFFEGPESLADVNAEISLRRRGFVAAKGSGLMRGNRVTFDTTANVGQAERRGSVLHRVPLKIALKGEQIDASFDGRMIMTGADIELQGQGELALPSGRGFARWFGAYWPSGSGLRDVSVRGQARFGRETLTFENAVARMDGNEATGVLGIRLKQPRPVLTGTLAYKSFDAKPYLWHAEVAAGGGLSWSSLAGGVLSVPLGMHLDADLRLSADRVVLGPVELERVAATIALKDGRLLGDIANLMLNGGEGGGQITADFTGFTPKVTVRGKLDQVDLAQLAGAFAGGQFVHGRVGVVADLTGAGNTLREVLSGMAGKLAVRAQTPGRLGLDLRALAGAVRTELQLTGWGPAMRGVTSYDALDLKLVLRDGTLLTETAELRTSDGTWTATGVVNLMTERIDLRLSQGGVGAPAGMSAAQSAVKSTVKFVAQSAAQSVLELHGPLREPRISMGSGP